MRSSASLDENNKELLNFLPEEVDRLDDIVSRYLDFARIEPLNLAQVDLAVLINETVALARREMAEKGVQIEVSVPEKLPSLRLDAPRIRQALLNLLLNAVQAMPRGGRIHVAVASTKKYVQLNVVDSGIGISKQQLGKIFEPFYTTKEKGSGLGLAMVTKIIEDHDGQIRVQSEPDKGTNFSLLLPIR
jgi:two-component system sensor histidine kinase HydH